MTNTYKFCPEVIYEIKKFMTKYPGTLVARTNSGHDLIVGRVCVQIFLVGNESISKKCGISPHDASSNYMYWRLHSKYAIENAYPNFSTTPITSITIENPPELISYLDSCCYEELSKIKNSSDSPSTPITSGINNTAITTAFTEISPAPIPKNVSGKKEKITLINICSTLNVKQNDE